MHQLKPTTLALYRHELLAEEFETSLYCGGVVFPWRNEYIPLVRNNRRRCEILTIPAGSYTREPGLSEHEPRYSGTARDYILGWAGQCIEVIRVLEKNPLRLACTRYISVEEPDDPVCRDPEKLWRFHELEGEDGICLDGYAGDNEVLLVPPAIHGRPVVRLCLGEDTLNETCRSLIISEGIREISLHLEKARGLKRLEFPTSAGLIDSPRGLEHTKWFLKQGDHPVYLGGYYCGTPNMGCGVRTELIIRDGTTDIAYGADFHCFWQRIVMPESVLRIHDLAFADARCLEELILPPQVERIGDFAFQRCPRLRTLDLPATLSSPTLPFMLCHELEEVTLSAHCPIHTNFDHCPRVILQDGNSVRSEVRGTIIPPCVGTLHACREGDPIDAAGRSYSSIRMLAMNPGENGFYTDFLGNPVLEMAEEEDPCEYGEYAEARHPQVWYLQKGGKFIEITFDKISKVYLVREQLAKEDLPEILHPKLEALL